MTNENAVHRRGTNSHNRIKIKVTIILQETKHRNTSSKFN